MDKPNTVNKAALAGYLEKVINDSYKAEEKKQRRQRRSLAHRR